MDSSLLKTLPLEIREMIYEKCFKDDFFATIKKPNSLALLQLCRELRTEAEQSLARRTKVIMNGNNMDTSAMTVLSPLQLIRLAPVVRAIPSHLNLNKLVFELRHDCRVIHTIKPSHTSDVVPPQFTANTRALVALVYPCEAVISVNMTFHKLAMVPYTKSLHEANPGKVRVVCPQDEPMTCQALENVMVKFSASDKTKAQNAADRAFARKRRQFEAHRTHKVCFVKLGINKALESLADAQGKINAAM